MNNFKKLTIGSMIIASLVLSSCSTSEPGGNDGVSESATASASQETKPEGDSTTVPTTPPNATVDQEISDKPLNIDVEESIEKYADPKVATTFPAPQFDVSKGVKIGLTVYQNLVQTEDFYSQRDGLKDADLIAPHLDKFHPKMHNGLMEEVKAKGKTNSLPVALPSGVFFTTDAGVNVIPAKMPESTWSTPALEVKHLDAVGNYVSINGLRRISVTAAEDGKKYEAVVRYNVGVTPSEDTWLICGMGWSVVSMEEIK